MGDTTRIPIRQVGATSSSAIKHAEHFYRRVPVVKPVYQTDEGELMPRPKKNGAVEVAMADAATVTVQQKEKETAVTYEATERPLIRFRGKLAVSELDASTTVAAAERTEVLPEEEVSVLAPETKASDVLVDVHEQSAHTTKTSAHGTHELSVEHLRGRGRLHAHSKQEMSTLPLLSNPDGIIGMQRPRIVDRNPHDATLKVDAPLLDARTTPSPIVLTVVALSAFLIAVGLVGVYSQVSVEANAMALEYQFTFRDLLQILRTSLPALLVHSF